MDRLAPFFHLSGLGEVPTAPPADPAPAGYYDEAGGYVFDYVLNANQIALGLSVPIDQDSDFIWMATYGTQTGTYKVNFKTARGRQIFSSPVNSLNAIGTAQFPTVWEPAFTYNASGRIMLDLTDTSGAQNTVQLVFLGVRRFKTR